MLAISIEQCHKLPKEHTSLMPYDLLTAVKYDTGQLADSPLDCRRRDLFAVSADSSGKKNGMAHSLNSRWQEGHHVHEWLHE